MKVFDVVTPCTYSQKHCVVAESMAEAEKIFNAKYWPTTILEIRLHSEYVEVQNAPQNIKEGASEQATNSAMVPCKNCGYKMLLSMKYCPVCGKARHQ